MKNYTYRCMLWDDRHDQCVYASLIDASNEGAAEEMFRQALCNSDYDQDDYPILIEEVRA